MVGKRSAGTTDAGGFCSEESALKSIAEAVPDGVWMFNPKGFYDNHPGQWSAASNSQTQPPASPKP